MDVIVISSDSDDSSPVFVFTPTKQPSCQLSRYVALYYYLGRQVSMHKHS